MEVNDLTLCPGAFVQRKQAPVSTGWEAGCSGGERNMCTCQGSTQVQPISSHCTELTWWPATYLIFRFHSWTPVGFIFLRGGSRKFRRNLHVSCLRNPVSTHRPRAFMIAELLQVILLIVGIRIWCISFLYQLYFSEKCGERCRCLPPSPAWHPISRYHNGNEASNADVTA